jgi:hypothetical protein
MTALLAMCHSRIGEASDSARRQCSFFVEDAVGLIFDYVQFPTWSSERTGIAAYLFGTGGPDSRVLSKMQQAYRSDENNLLEFVKERNFGTEESRLYRDDRRRKADCKMVTVF